MYGWMSNKSSPNHFNKNTNENLNRLMSENDLRHGRLRFDSTFENNNKTGAVSTMHPVGKGTKAMDMLDMICHMFTGSVQDFIAFLDPSREITLLAIQRQIKAHDGILDSYRKLKQAFKQLQDGYLTSKDSTNFIHRYTEMKRMVRQIVSLETNYSILIDLPKRELTETQADFLTRVLAAMDQRSQTAAPGSIGGIASGSMSQLADRAKDVNLIEQLKPKSTEELRKDHVQLQNSLYKLIKKYANLRALVSQLKYEYNASKGYPIIPRYSMLKRMIKSALRSPAFAEVAHEVDTEFSIDY